MTPTKSVPVLNPRYAGATPEDVARALLRPLQSAARTGRKPVRGREDKMAASQSQRGEADR